LRVFGIDCGSQRTGYGIIDSGGRRHRLVVAGVIQTSPKTPFPVRLKDIYCGLKALLEQHAPDSVAVEEVFYAANVKTALQLAHVRGVSLLAAAEAGLPIGEYSPLEIKGSVVGYGRADKKQVQMMVASLLGLAEPVRSFDASDALAAAICHANVSQASAAIAAGEVRRA
jgi:crossover junction endodeoxyribonuclease RuvC